MLDRKRVDIQRVTSQYGAIYGIHDQHLGQMASTPPRRPLAPGKADIGGRLRVASILREVGIRGASPERISGSTNEVWSAGRYIVRISFEPGSTRLRREAILAAHLSSSVRYPNVIASGEAAFGEWLVIERIPGRVLSSQWSDLDVIARRRSILELAGMLKTLHSAELDEETQRQWEARSAPTPYAKSADSMLDMLDQLTAFPFVDHGLIEDARDRVDEVRSTFEAAQGDYAVLHGDLHLENVLADDANVTGLIDLEWSHRGLREVDIDTLARFCVAPQLHISGSYAVSAGDFRDVLRWMAEGYPEVFEHPRLRDRLTWCALSYEIPALLDMVPEAPARSLPNWHPVNRLSELLSFGSAAVLLGW